MQYKENDVVTIYDDNLEAYVSGLIIEQISEVMITESIAYWVKFGPHNNVGIFYESDLDSWNNTHPIKCECGSSKTNQPRHSYYCPLFRENE